MNNDEIKVIWKVSKRFWIGSFIFWILETVAFLSIEGWHWKATNPIEIWFDSVVLNMWKVALTLTVYCCYYLISNINKK